MALPEKPLTRREVYLAKAAGQDVTLPEEDITREELYLRAIAEGSGGGGTSPFYPAGNIAFANLPELSADILGAMYNVTDAFTTDSRFNEGTGVKYPAGTNVAVVNIGAEESPTYKYDTFVGAYTVDDALSNSSENPVQNKVITAALGNKADTSALNNYVQKEQGKSLSTNDYTDADKALVQDSPITVSATGSDLTLSTSSGNINALTVYGKSEVVDGSIKSAGEGWATVDLGTLAWTYTSVDGQPCFETQLTGVKRPASIYIAPETYCAMYETETWYKNRTNATADMTVAVSPYYDVISIRNSNYTDATAFKTAMSGVILCYQLADPTQGNCIAIKTDNGSGIDGTMATFSTGTPLRGIPDTSVRDVMEWDGSSGEVTKNCGKVRLADLTWNEPVVTENRSVFDTIFDNFKQEPNDTIAPNLLTADFQSVANSATWMPGNISNRAWNNSIVLITEPTITTVTDLKASLGDAELVYELATHTTAPLTSTENDSIAGLRTFEPQTHAQNNAGATMTVEAYAGTANGAAVQELKQGVQSEISALKITQSGMLTLTTAGWSNNAQTVTYEHDTAKRNVIDVDPTSVEEWASCGVLATAETSSGITFTCKTVPENALNFRVTSMGV